MRLTSSIRLLAMAVLLAAPAAAAASPPGRPSAVEPLVTPRAIAPSIGNDVTPTAHNDVAVLLSRNSIAERSGVTASGAAHASSRSTIQSTDIAMADTAQRLRPRSVDQVAVTNMLATFTSSRAADPPNRMAPVILTQLDTSRSPSPRVSHSLRL